MESLRLLDWLRTTSIYIDASTFLLTVLESIHFIKSVLIEFDLIFRHESVIQNISSLHSTSTSMSFQWNQSFILFLFTSIPLYFGILTCGAGILGILIGTTVASHLKNNRGMVNGDAIVCAVGMLGSAVALFLALVCCQYNLVAAWVSMILSQQLCTRKMAAERIVSPIGFLWEEILVILNFRLQSLSNWLKQKVL